MATVVNAATKFGLHKRWVICLAAERLLGCGEELFFIEGCVKEFVH